LWEKWRKLGLYLARPELKLDGTNNASERSIGRSKVRYKSMRGHKSMEGMSNAIALTQWLYDGEDEHDLAKEPKRWRRELVFERPSEQVSKFAHRLWDSYRTRADLPEVLERV